MTSMVERQVCDWRQVRGSRTAIQSAPAAEAARRRRGRSRACSATLHASAMASPIVGRYV